MLVVGCHAHQHSPNVLGTKNSNVDSLGTKNSNFTSRLHCALYIMFWHSYSKTHVGMLLEGCVMSHSSAYQSQQHNQKKWSYYLNMQGQYICICLYVLYSICVYTFNSPDRVGVTQLINNGVAWVCIPWGTHFFPADQNIQPN